MELHAAVQRAVAARRFHDPPILLGAVLSLADEQWATAVEAAMGSKLDNWVVGSYADQAVLKVGGRGPAQLPLGSGMPGKSAEARGEPPHVRSHSRSLAPRLPQSLRRELRTPLKSFNTIVYPFNTPQVRSSLLLPCPALRCCPSGAPTVR